MLPPMAVRLAADLRPSVDESAVRTWLSCRQAASVPIAQGSCAPRAGTDRRTDRSIAECPLPPHLSITIELITVGQLVGASCWCGRVIGLTLLRSAEQQFHVGSAASLDLRLGLRGMRRRRRFADSSAALPTTAATSMQPRHVDAKKPKLGYFRYLNVFARTNDNQQVWPRRSTRYGSATHFRSARK